MGGGEHSEEAPLKYHQISTRLYGIIAQRFCDMEEKLKRLKEEAE